MTLSQHRDREILNQMRRLEVPTLLMLAGTYVVWFFGLSLWASMPVLAVVLVALAVVQHASLQHEVLHGHPFDNQLLNEALVFPALGLFVSYLRFKDTHLQHHFDPALTDPYDDPESNYMDPAVWARIGWAMRLLCRVNNTLAGRILIGPILGTFGFLWQDFLRARHGDRRVIQSYALHMVSVILALAVVIGMGVPIWVYLIAVYLGTAVLKIRTYLEHRAHEAARARTVIVEDRGPLSYLFLNNNLHVVHHCMPKVAWYELPSMYRAKRDYYLRRNEAYVYSSYRDVFKQYLFRAKEPVPHPIFPVNKTPD